MAAEPAAAAERPEDQLLGRAEALCMRLRARPDARSIKDSRALLLPLRNLRAFELLVRLAEALCRVDPVDPPDPTTRRLYAQGLIETGATHAAIALLRQLLQTVPKSPPEAVEAGGLIGRAYKQMFFDRADARSAPARRALARAVDAYRAPYKTDPKKNTWRGVNLLALVSRARREGWDEIAPAIDPAKLALQLQATLDAVPPKARDDWHLPTLAEVTLGLALGTGEPDPVETLLKQYIANPQARAFQVASTLRQFVEVWGLETLTARTPGFALKGAALQRARALVEILRARLLQLPGGELVLHAVQAKPARALAARTKTQAAAEPPAGQLEVVLGVDGPQTYHWWRAGVDAARSVGVVRQRLGQRTGTGFLVRAGDFGLGDKMPADTRLLITNYHVVNPDGVVPRSLRPDQTQVVFEAVDSNVAYRVTELLWCSPIEQHDCALLQLERAPAGLLPLPLGNALPALPPPEQKKRLASTSWATRAGVSCRSASRTTRCSTTRVRPPVSLKPRASCAFITVRRPRAVVRGVRCSTKPVGPWSRCTTVAGSEACRGSTAWQAATQPTKGWRWGLCLSRRGRRCWPTSAGRSLW